MTATIEVLRIGQRPVRDDRVTTHAALVARAFGASRIYMTEANPEIRQGIRAINETWGGRFEVEYVDGWRPVLREKVRQGYTVVHLSMYGESINDVQDELRRRAADGAARMLVVVGAKKVPREVYDAADYNVSVGGQPHSEIAALAVLLDRIYRGAQLGQERFGGARRRIVPSRHGKQVESRAYGDDGDCRDDSCSDDHADRPGAREMQ